jgi:microcompartment protein CcmK/EutM
MKLGTVIGRVTLSQVVPSLVGARWLVVSPYGREQYAEGCDGPPVVSRETNLVVYDSLGAGVGQTIGYVEGREAAQPFAKAPPIDAVNAALVDKIFYQPMP